MKRFSWIMGLILCVVCTVQAKDRVIERPPFLAWSSSNIEVDKIVMSDTVTTVYIKAFYRPKYWIKIASGSFLKDEKGALYPIRKGVGITLDKEFWMPESGEAEFQLLFPPIPANVTSLDFSEGDFDGVYKIWGIQLNEKDFRKSALPKGAVIHKINKKAELPVPEFAYGKATLKGQVTGYQKDMPSSGQLRLNDPIRWLNYAEEVTIKEDGSFQVQTDVITVTPSTLHKFLACWLLEKKVLSSLTQPSVHANNHISRKTTSPMAKKLIKEVIWLTFNKSYQTILFQVTWLTTRARLSKM